MTKCFISLTEARNICYRSTFTKSGLQSTTTDLLDGATTMHCWIPKTPILTKPNLLLIHGFGPNALWQWGDVIHKLTSFFNVYVPDLVFFGGSYSTKPDRTEQFQAECVMKLMEMNSVKKMSVVGLSYGGFVVYTLAAMYKEAVERVVVCAAGVCMEEKDISQGLFVVSDVEEAVRVLVPQTVDKLKELIGYTMYKPPPMGLLPSCLLSDFIETMCNDYVEEKRDLIRAIPKNRKILEIPKITQPTMILWGEHDQVFRLEFGQRLKRHIGENAELIVIKKAGHGFNIEKTKEYFTHLKTFLVDHLNKSSSVLPV
ncbi:hypothetical protein ACFE04_025780 [Oxalis oulophora]